MNNRQAAPLGWRTSARRNSIESSIAHKPQRAVAVTAETVTDFWRDAGPERWFEKDAAFDTLFRERFLALHFSAARRERDSWAQTAQGSLALLILLDQFPRNSFRGTAHMYATDALALHFARRVQAMGQSAAIAPELRVFLHLPFCHSENLADQDLSVQFSTPLGGPALEHAQGHREVIRRFGRFPHRNALFGRETTVEEQAFLDEGGFSG